MKKLAYLFFAAALCFLYSCDDTVKETIRYNINEPVFMPADVVRNSIKVSTKPQQISQLGKMCFYEGYLYISEPEKGIHIIDNRNPANPLAIGFIEIMGNADLAIRNNVLYADSYVDLVWFDIVNPAKPQLKNRLENVFLKALPLADNQYGYDYNMCYSAENAGKIVVGWKTAERVEVITHHTGGGDLSFAGPQNSVATSGKNGSMSRFSVYKDYLYTVDNSVMNIFNITGEIPQPVSDKISVGWDVETIFSYKDCMFFGTRTGMRIFSVKDPVKPEFQSSISHIYACDPVVVENDIAYVTIRSGNFCGQNVNELIVFDVSDVKKPKSIVSYNMTNPKGLGIDNGTLFLCDDGLKIYKSEDPQKLMANNLAHYKGMDGYDVIPYNNILMMVANDGLYQYDYSNLLNIRQLSKLPIIK